MGRVTLDPSGIARQPQTDPALQELETAMLRKEIISGTFIDMKNEGGAEKTLCYIKYKSQKICVPIYEMGINFDQHNNVNHMENEWVRRNQIANSMLGCEVDVLIKQIRTDEKTGVMMIGGSREEAMRKQRYKHFFSRDPIINDEVDEVEVRVISVAKQSIRVELFGVEQIIRMTDLCWTWIYDVRKKFHVGDVIWVKIKNRELDFENRTVKLELSHKELFEDTASKAIMNLKENQSCCVGTITRITDGTYWPVFIGLENGANVVSYRTRIKEVPNEGDMVKVLIKYISYDQGNANGTIVGIVQRKEEE